MVKFEAMASLSCRTLPVGNWSCLCEHSVHAMRIVSACWRLFTPFMTHATAVCRLQLTYSRLERRWRPRGASPVGTGWCRLHDLAPATLIEDSEQSPCCEEAS